MTVGECERSLIHQLRVYRNYNLTILEVVGFVIPTSSTQCECLEVTIQWDIDTMRFSSKIEIIDPTQLVNRIIIVCKRQEAIISKFCIQRNEFGGFFLPIDAKHHFGEGAIQLPAGRSVVVAHNKHIYKLVINLTLLSSYETKICKNYTKLKTLGCISLPEVIQGQNGNLQIWKQKDFIKFDRKICPLRRGEAKFCLKDFLLKIYCALEKLHKCGFGHFDVRLENICFDYDGVNGYKVVLIDLDLLQAFKKHPYGLASKSRMSYMPHSTEPHSTEPHSTDFGLVDWCQLGLIMTSFIASHPFEVGQESYHDPEFHYPSVVSSDPFIKKLLNEGKTQISNLEAVYLFFCF